MTFTIKPALTTATGVVALTFLLAGCTGGADSPDADATPRGGATATADAAESASTGEFTLPADCDAAAAVLGDALGDRALDTAASSVTADQATCTWTSATDGSRMGFIAQAKELDEAGMDAEVPRDSRVEGLTLEPADDERVDAFGGRAFLATAAEGSPVVGGGAFLATPHGLLSIIAAAPAGTPVTVTPEQSLDLALAFVD